MYNKKTLSDIVKNLGSAKAPTKKQDIIYDPMGQWTNPGQDTRVPTSNGNITMGANPETGQSIPFPVFAQPNVGPGVMMQPGQDYTFPGAKYVDEFPQVKKGGLVRQSKKYSKSLMAKNILFVKNALLNKKKSVKNKIFDPNSPYFEDGGTFEMELDENEIDQYKQGGYIVEELDAYAKGGSSSCPKDHVWDSNTKKCVKVYTLANDKKLIDGVSNWAMQSNDPDKISSEYNDQIKHYLYSGKYGYDPVSGTLYPLKKEQKTVADAETKKILAKQDDKAAYTQSIIDAGFDPDTFGKSKGTNVITGEEIYGDKSQEDVDKINKEALNNFVTEGHKKAILESPFNIAASFTPAGMVAGVIQGGAALLPDAYNFAKDPSWSGAGAIGGDLLMMAPGLNKFGKPLVNAIDNAVYPTRTYRASLPGGNEALYEASDLSKKVFNKGNFTTKNLDEARQYLAGSEATSRQGLLTGQDMNLTEYKVPFWKKNVSFDPDVVNLKNSQGVDINTGEYIIPNNKFLYPRKTTQIKAVPEELKVFNPEQLSSGDLPYYSSSIPVGPASDQFASKPWKYIEDQINAVTGHDMPLTWNYDPSLGPNQNIPLYDWEQPQFPVNKGFKYGGLNKHEEEGMILDLSPKEIEEYKKGGYIIEDISIPSLNQMQDGAQVKGSQGLNSDFSTSLTAFINAAKADGIDLGIGSGFRSVEKQKQLWEQALKKYGSPEKARKWVAPPGKSNHNKGIAVDLSSSGVFLGKNKNTKATEWAHANAEKFGLHFRMGWEPWHIEPLNLSKEQKAKIDAEHQHSDNEDPNAHVDPNNAEALSKEGIDMTKYYKNLGKEQEITDIDNDYSDWNPQEEVVVDPRIAQLNAYSKLMSPSIQNVNDMYAATKINQQQQQKQFAEITNYKNGGYIVEYLD
jgi:LAS superfamily LD-carboxypeptidase LdcB